MKIEVLYFRGCPTHAPTVERVRHVVRCMQIDADIVEVEVTPEHDASKLKFLGSPTVLVEDQDIDPACRHNATYSFCCRTYDGIGVPPEALIARALCDG